MPIPLIWGLTVAFGFLAWSVFARNTFGQR
jgi:hypothetical protein